MEAYCTKNILIDSNRTLLFSLTLSFPDTIFHILKQTRPRFAIKILLGFLNKNLSRISPPPSLRLLRLAPPKKRRRGLFGAAMPKTEKWEGREPPPPLLGCLPAQQQRRHPKKPDEDRALKPILLLSAPPSFCRPKKPNLSTADGGGGGGGGTKVRMGPEEEEKDSRDFLQSFFLAKKRSLVCCLGFSADIFCSTDLRPSSMCKYEGLATLVFFQGRVGQPLRANPLLRNRSLPPTDAEAA